MGMTLPKGQGYKTWNNTKAVSLISHADAGDTRYSISAAIKRAPNYKEMAASGGVYTGANVVFLLPAPLVTAAGATGNARPKPSDRIELESVDYTILEATPIDDESVWKCITLDLVLAYDLRSTLSVRRPPATTVTDDAGGRLYTGQTTPYAAIPCRFQETSARNEDIRGKRVTVKTYTVFVLNRLRLTMEDQIIDAAGEVYQLNGWRDADRIDQLQTLECEKAWGTI